MKFLPNKTGSSYFSKPFAEFDTSMVIDEFIQLLADSIAFGIPKK